MECRGCTRRLESWQRRLSKEIVAFPKVAPPRFLTYGAWRVIPCLVESLFHNLQDSAQRELHSGNFAERRKSAERSSQLLAPLVARNLKKKLQTKSASSKTARSSGSSWPRSSA